MIPSPLGVPAKEYARACESGGVSGGYAGALERYAALYRDGAFSQPHLSVPVPTPTRVHESESNEGVVRKFTLALEPSAGQAPAVTGKVLETESVIIPMIGRKRVLTHTLCVSSQVGCAMGCGFCQTAQMGLLRNLTVEKIVNQWLAAAHVVGGYRPDRPGCDTIRNIVFMGMGEPTDNLDAVLGAIAVLTDHRGPGLPMSKVTISTVGRVDGIAKLAERVRTDGWHRLNLAVSLNAPNDEIRTKIMPVNKANPLSRLRESMENWPIYGAAKLCLEYVLIPGVNDAPAHAVELADYVKGRGPYAGRPELPGLVNLIPYNPREHSPWPAPTEEQADEFLGMLTNAGVYAKRRRTKGRDTMAACGQLGNLEHRRRPLVQIGR